ncbi:FMN-binding protein [Candidatus Omnitrophota bacterium]
MKILLRKTIFVIISICYIFGGVFFSPAHALTEATEEDMLLRLIQTTFPEAVSYSTSDDPGIWMNVYNAAETVIGYAVVTSPYTDDVVGYMGPIPLLICIDTQEKIKEVTLIHHFETPGLMEILLKEGFFNVWTGEHWRAASTKEVDAISGATLSSQAIIDTLKHRLNTMNSPQKKEE